MMATPDESPNSKSLPLKLKGGKGKRHCYFNLGVKAVELFAVIRKAGFRRPWGKLLLLRLGTPFENSVRGGGLYIGFRNRKRYALFPNSKRLRK